jgi:hypothetical protein
MPMTPISRSTVGRGSRTSISAPKMLASSRSSNSSELGRRRTASSSRMLADERVLVVLAHEVVLVLRLARTGEKAVLRRSEVKVLKRLERVECMVVVVVVVVVVELGSWVVVDG